ncbi:UNVERIFIED_CONTAM: hypothetical protein GTU68_066379 [Idotea baltica]|nr:hypothetical protein [Idotea baltica]
MTITWLTSLRRRL